MMDSVEWAGFVLSLAMVYCNIKEIHWGWPFAIASSMLYGVVFWNSQLYGQAGLQAMFVLMAAWGWRQWLSNRDQDPLVISSLHRKERLYVFGAGLLAWLICGFILTQFTDSEVAIWDALVTAMALIGQYLLGRKKIENWWVWLMVNVLTMGLMVSQSLWPTTLLYGLFAILSVVGLRAWRQQHAE
jgi:nicotinamide mononucleotide transporter